MSEFDDFGDFVSSDPIPTQNSHSLLGPAMGSQPASTSKPMHVLRSEELLKLFYTDIFLSADGLLASLVPLSFTLKKKVISNIKTRNFIQALVNISKVAQNIIWGRYSNTRYRHDADRQARKVIESWNRLAVRLRALHIPRINIDDLVLDEPLEKTSGGHYECPVCGRRNQLQGDHVKCSTWYNHFKH